MGYKAKRRWDAVLVYGALTVISLICIFPIAWMCLISLKPATESISGFHSIIVQDPTLANFKRLFEMIPLGQNLFNSVFTTLISSVYKELHADRETGAADNK